jgi:hypothetical protein
MDFKKLLSQLDDIEQRQLLRESEELLERAHIKDVEATANITDKAQRYAALAKLAKDGKYAGMFDPVTGNFIDQNGNAAWFGAYRDEVAQLAKHGLIPNSAKEKTSHFLGMMGMDEKEAGAIQTDVRTREEAIQKATGLIDKALESLKAQPKADVNKTAAVGNAGKDVDNQAINKESYTLRSGLAQALTESFGYNYTSLIESISREDHQYIKKVLAQVEKVEGDDDVTEFKAKYAEYTKRRDQLIEQIRALVGKLKSTVKESSQLDEGFMDWAKAIGRKIAMPVVAVMEVKDAWDAIKALPKDKMSREQFKGECAKILVEKVAKFGVATVAFIIGELLGTLGGLWTGPGALISGFVVGTGAAIAASVTSNVFVEKASRAIVDALYPEGAEKTDTNNGTGDKTSQAKPVSQIPFNANVQKLQQAIERSGISIKFHDDGKFGKETLAGLRAYKQKIGAKSDLEAISKAIGVPLDSEYKRQLT